VSVVMPVYNEESVIGDILDQVAAQPLVDEIIVVDDGSTDDTAAIVRAHPAARMVAHPYNIGNGAAVKSGIRAASGEIILLMDADGQHPPAEIPSLLQHIDRYDMVVGARSAGTQARRHRTFANRLFNAYASYIVGHPVPDLTSGFRAVRAPIARSFLYLLPNGFSYPTTLTICLFRAGYAVHYQPFASPARTGSSKIRPLRDGLRFLLTLTRLGTLFVPLKIFLPLSLLFLLAGGSYTIGKLATVHRFSGFGGLAISIGVVLFMLGLISEQIALLRYINSDR
ncbi:MAG: glycosyltransferase family 2 protein, partial [Anaerolineae bacterium]|nr:glycosyltransferase family 2 protein [Anaerolineae bacterium]